MIIMIDRGRLMTANVESLQRFDWALNSALALALTGIKRGDRVGILDLFSPNPWVYCSPVD
jgi:uncharacterized protein (DUF58 family)